MTTAQFGDPVRAVIDAIHANADVDLVARDAQRQLQDQINELNQAQSMIRMLVGRYGNGPTATRQGGTHHATAGPAPTNGQGSSTIEAKTGLSKEQRERANAAIDEMLATGMTDTDAIVTRVINLLGGSEAILLTQPRSAIGTMVWHARKRRAESKEGAS